MGRIDSYVTSEFTLRGVPDSGIHPRYTRFGVECPMSMTPVEKHSYAHQCYIHTIREPTWEARGFPRSPFHHRK